MPDGNAVVLTRLRVTGRASSVNSGAPCPTAAGSTQSRYSSTRPSRIRDRANLVPPWAMISPPGSCFSRASSSAVSPRAIRAGGQVVDWRLAENTTLGISFMGAAIGWSELGQNLAISS